MAISQITEIDKCCGCGVCESVCPRNCIKMAFDNEGFLYPQINAQECVECKLCIKSCPINFCPDSSNVLYKREVYACKNTNKEILYKSSSGGVFYEISKYVLNNNGVVFGVIYKDKEAIYAMAENEDELMPMLGSKYVQSNKYNIWPNVKRQLKTGKLVLFSGTPCEIGALRGYLRKDYDNLICVDFICMGTPSPAVFQRHLRDLEDQYGAEITSLSCRSKEYGANTHSLTLEFKNGKKYFRPQFAEPYIKSFHSRLYMRKSCHQCAYKKELRESDFTMADFWGIDKLKLPISKEGGISMLIIQSSKAKRIFEEIKNHFEIYPTSMDIAKEVQPMMISSCSASPKRDLFFQQFNSRSDERFSEIINDFIPITKLEKLRSCLKRVKVLRIVVQSIKRLK